MNLAFKSLSCRLFDNAIDTTEVSSLKIIAKIHYILSSKYLTTKNIAEEAIENLGPGEKLGAEGLFNLFILLLIEEKI